MSSRRPPSQRNAEYAEQRYGRQLQSMSPGTAGGRLASAAPVRLTSDALAAINPGVDGASELLFAYDTFALTGAAPTLSLSYVPADGSLHVYLNGLEQIEGTDYTLAGLTLSVLAAMNTGSGDTLDARYAYSSDQGAVPAETTFTDNFDRADSTTTLGAPWSTGSLGSTAGSTWGISSNRAYCVSTYQDTFGTIFTSAAYVTGNSADVDMQVDLINPVFGGSGGLVFRADAALSTFFLATADKLIQSTAGTVTTRGSYSTSAVSGNTLRVVASGTSITVYVAGAVVLTYTTSATTNVRAGLAADAINNPSARFDNFSLVS
ncbi:MAG: hypothetical protein ACXV5Q_00655 [Frankiaceae bacterium]